MFFLRRGHLLKSIPILVGVALGLKVQKFLQKLSLQELLKTNRPHNKVEPFSHYLTAHLTNAF